MQVYLGPRPLSVNMLYLVCQWLQIKTQLGIDRDLMAVNFIERVDKLAVWDSLAKQFWIHYFGSLPRNWWKDFEVAT